MEILACRKSAWASEVPQAQVLPLAQGRELPPEKVSPSGPEPVLELQSLEYVSQPQAAHRPVWGAPSDVVSGEEAREQMERFLYLAP